MGIGDGDRKDQGTELTFVLLVFQKVPIHGAEPTTAGCRAQGQDAGYPKDAGYGPVSQDEKGLFVHGDWRGKRRMKGANGYGKQDEPEPIETTFELNETLYAKANIPPTDEVYIWLGVSWIGLIFVEG